MKDYRKHLFVPILIYVEEPHYGKEEINMYLLCSYVDYLYGEEYL